MINVTHACERLFVYLSTYLEFTICLAAIGVFISRVSDIVVSTSAHVRESKTVLDF